MTLPTLVWGSPGWATVAAGLMGLAVLALLWSYLRARGRTSTRLLAAGFKLAGFLALALCLVEPLLAGSRPRKGANAFAIVVDNSQSLKIRDPGSDRSRGEQLVDALRDENPWRTRLGQDFDVRSYAFDANLHAVEGFRALAFDGASTAIPSTLDALAKRFRGLPLAGVLLVTDGNSTELTDVDWAKLPPVYPVAPSSGASPRDVGVTSVSVTQANFESAPVVVRADVTSVGFSGVPVVACLLDEAGKELERQEDKPSSDGKPLGFRFQFRPESKGVRFYRVRVFAANDPSHGQTLSETPSLEQTLANNERWVVVDQGGGPYRILYATGRPNWEFKFLRRALSDDDQLQLVGLLRIAKRQPKFDFQASGARTASPLFTGFDHPDAEVAERADQPVLVRLGTVDDTELRDGFPKDAEELYKYHAIILDDLEASFFSPDQLALLREFVSRRGGGLLMLGGPDSFREGKYDRTPVGDLLPVYLDGSGERLAPSDDRQPVEEAVGYRLALTREGWLQPWVRTRKTEDEEKRRLESTVPFETLSRVGKLKPGASVLAEVLDPAGTTAPALVAQSFGRGRAAALLIGDLWRWGLRRAEPTEDDFDRAWRQTARWLVAEVPGRVEVSIKPKAGDGASTAVELVVRVRDPRYLPLDDAKVTLELTLPDGGKLELTAEGQGREPGVYSASYVARQVGPHRVLARASAPDGSTVGEREAGWAAQPGAEEFARLEPNRAYLATIAEKTGGEVVDPAKLDAFVTRLASRDAPITEPWTAPLWHQPAYFLIAIACLAVEWGLRRTGGLA
jgi:uncharacterized membrane protein